MKDFHDACKAPPSTTIVPPMLKPVFIRYKRYKEASAMSSGLTTRPTGRRVPLRANVANLSASGNRRQSSVSTYAHFVDPDRPQFGGKALHHALDASEHAGVDPSAGAR
jgi:hypothetical protein